MKSARFQDTGWSTRKGRLVSSGSIPQPVQLSGSEQPATEQQIHGVGVENGQQDNLLCSSS